MKVLLTTDRILFAFVFLKSYFSVKDRDLSEIFDTYVKNVIAAINPL